MGQRPERALILPTCRLNTAKASPFASVFQRAVGHGLRVEWAAVLVVASGVMGVARELNSVRKHLFFGGLDGVDVVVHQVGWVLWQSGDKATRRGHVRELVD